MSDGIIGSGGVAAADPLILGLTGAVSHARLVEGAARVADQDQIAQLIRVGEVFGDLEPTSATQQVDVTNAHALERRAGRKRLSFQNSSRPMRRLVDDH